MQDSSTIEKLKYPIGQLQIPASINDDQLKQWIDDIASFPSKLTELVEGLSYDKLNWKYRPDGWTIKQLIHHCADSHMNALIRFKIGLTEDKPTIRPYLEAKWAELADTLECSITESLKIIEGVHSRWIILLNSLNNPEWEKEFLHPEYNQVFKLREYVANYAWHCNHHLAHIEQALRFKGEF